MLIGWSGTVTGDPAGVSRAFFVSAAAVSGGAFYLPLDVISIEYEVVDLTNTYEVISL